MLRDGEEAMSIGKSFQTEAPATGKVRLPMVESRQRGTSSLWDAAERKFERPETSFQNKISRIQKALLG